MRHRRFHAIGHGAMAVLTVLSVALVVWIVSWQPGWRTVAGLSDRSAPDLADAETLDGKPFRLADRLGKVVVLSFWSQTALPAREHVAAIDALQQRYADDDGVVIVGFNVDVHPGSELTTDDVRAFLQARHLTLPQVIDATGRAFRAYQVHGVPRDVVIGPDGLVRGVHVGHDPDAAERLASAIERWRRSAQGEPVPRS